MPRKTEPTVRKSPYDVHPGVAMIQDWIANLPQKTGKTLEEWLALVRESGPTSEKSVATGSRKNMGWGPTPLGGSQNVRKGKA